MFNLEKKINKTNFVEPIICCYNTLVRMCEYSIYSGKDLNFVYPIKQKKIQISDYTNKRDFDSMHALNKLEDFNENVRIKNILIFVSDSLRWDYLPESIKKQGITFKTVAASLFTASSFPSMLTGLYPYNHHVYSFFDKIPSYISTLLDIPDFETSLYCKNTWAHWNPKGGSQIHEVLKCGPPIPLEEITPPFVYVEDEKGGHCPYGWTEKSPYTEAECLPFFREYSIKPVQKLHMMYAKGIARSVKEFEQRLAILEDRGLLDETLIVFTSDHGEILGEHGYLVGHGNFTTPELVYVPTVFIHSDLPPIHSENSGIMRHVDLVPTLADFLKVKNPKSEGTSLLNIDTLPRYGKSFYKFTLGPLSYIERGIWDAHGGHVFKEGVLLRILREMQCIVRPASMEGIYLRGKLKSEFFSTIRNYPARLKTELSPHVKFGNPSIGVTAAQKMAQDTPIMFDEKNILDSKIAHLKKEGLL